MHIKRAKSKVLTFKKISRLNYTPRAVYMKSIYTTGVFDAWFESLCDKRAARRIQARIDRAEELLAQKVCLNYLATLAWVVRVCKKPRQAMAIQALRRSSKSLQRWASTFTHNQLLAPKRIRARGEAVSKLKFWQRGRGARKTSDRSGV